MRQMLKSGTLLIAIALISLVALTNNELSAQGLTTAGINGLVTDKGGNPLIGANIVAIHTPSGTVFGAVSREDGRFNIINVKVGGPYSIKVSYIGYKSEEVTVAKLELSQNLKLNFKLNEETIQGQEIVVTGDRNSLMSSSRIGAATNVDTKAIESLPTLNRSIADFTRLTPTINGNSAGGRNNRYNNIQVDGAVLNDVFGLPANGTPGGQANTQAISLDAIQEFQVAIAPYDVRQSGFTGGSINAITRSGTNKFDGSAYWYNRNEKLVGKSPTDQKFTEFSDNTFGARFGGPILEDQLFFFVNGEYQNRKEPNQIQMVQGGSGGNIFPYSQDSVIKFSNFLKSKYGYDAGSYSQFTDKSKNGKLFLRFDANINEGNRLTFRHNFVSATDDNLTRTSSVFSLANRNYVFESVQNSSVLQLNSTIGSNMSNEFRVAYTRVRDQRLPDGSRFPSVRVKMGSYDLYAGMENFSVKNQLDQDVWEITNDFSYYLDGLMGSHVLTAGTHNEFFNFRNLFMRNAYGLYEFNSLSDFTNEKKASRYELSYSLVAGESSPAAKFSAYQLGGYIQDEWTPMPELKVTGGIRIDVPVLPDAPLFNAIFDSSFSAYGYHQNDVPSGKILFSPRLGVNYDVFGDRTLQVRGGTGVFTGRVPFVWISNQYGNTGMDIGRVLVTSTTGTPVFNSNPDTQAKPGDVGSNLAPVKTSEINLTTSDFKFPQLWRNNIAVDYQLPFDFIATAEYIYSKSLNDAYYEDANIGAQNGTLADGRPQYRTVNPTTFAASNNRVDGTNFTNVMVMKNTDQGYQSSLTAQIQKETGKGEELGDFMKDIYFSFAYTYSRSEDLNSVNSSQAVSQVRFNGVADPKSIELATSDYEVKNRIISVLSYDFDWQDIIGLSGWKTNLTFVYEGRSGSPYSYRYNGDVNGDGFDGNDLLYVPKDQTDIILLSSTSSANGASADQSYYDALFSFISKDSYLNDNKGKILKRNAGTLPFYHQVDFKLAQDLGIPTMEGHRLQLTLDILNVGNLLSKTWGRQKFVTNGQPIRYIGIATSGVNQGKQVFFFDKNLVEPQTYSESSSRWYMQIGVRYTF